MWTCAAFYKQSEAKHESVFTQAMRKVVVITKHAITVEKARASPRVLIRFCFCCHVSACKLSKLPMYLKVEYIYFPTPCALIDECSLDTGTAVTHVRFVIIGY